jgi:hypothetical protein
MLIKAFGTFWRKDEVDWHPGTGNKGLFRLLGRRGKNKGILQLADFREQSGIYILYGNYGPHYVGLTRRRGGIGSRLKDHLIDNHADKWDRFTWFGFRSVLNKKDEQGLRKLKELASTTIGSPKDMIGDMEALLIQAMGLSNKAQMKFSNAKRWQQVKQHEIKPFMKKVAR